MRFSATIAFMFFTVVAGAAEGDTAGELAKASPEALVEMLASRNPTPEKCLDGDPPEKPVGYDSAKQDRVYLAWNELSRREASEVLPALVPNLDNQKYSCTHDWNGFGFRNYTVGHVCWEILIMRLNRYMRIRSNGRDLRSFPAPDYCRDVLVDKKGAEKWFAGRREKTWRELQIESFEYLLKTENENGFENEVLAESYLRVEAALKALKESNRAISPDYIKPYSRL